MRHTKKHSTKGDRGSINTVNGLSIHERPEEIKHRKTYGHWEGDLISGSGNSHIATLVERKSRFTILAQLEGKDTDSVISALNRELLKLPLSIRKTLTWDRGMELSNHLKLTRRTKMKVYFYDPKSPWQRGTNENTNGLIRQYFPRKTPLGHFLQADLNRVSKELNSRPRKILDYQTPEEVLLESVALTS